MTQPQTPPIPETTLDWFKTHAFREHSKMLQTPSVQIALRQHLRLSYWLSKCQPISSEAVARACRMISFADTPVGAVPVAMGQEHINAVLCPDQGFEPITDLDTGEHQGWAIPEMLGMIATAQKSYGAGAQGRAERAQRAAAARWAPKPPQDHPTPPRGSNTATTGGNVGNSEDADF